MRWLRIALLLIGSTSLIATMVSETTEAKVLSGCVGSSIFGLIWAVLLHYAPPNDWKQLTDNVNEAQRLIDQSSFWSYRRKLYGLQPRSKNDSLDILETLTSLPLIGLFLAIGIMLGFDQNLRGYVLDLQQPHPPGPETLLLYVGFLACLSTAFLGLFSKLLVRVLPR